MEDEAQDIEKAENFEGKLSDKSSESGPLKEYEAPSVSGTNASGWLRQRRRLFLHFEVLNARQHKVIISQGAAFLCRSRVDMSSVQIASMYAGEEEQKLIQWQAISTACSTAAAESRND